MIGLSLWSENPAKLTLFCVKHGQHRAGCGDASMMGLYHWSENSAKLPIFCAPIPPKMLPTALLARASRKTAIAISLRSDIYIYIYIYIYTHIYIDFNIRLISEVGQDTDIHI